MPIESFRACFQSQQSVTIYCKSFPDHSQELHRSDTVVMTSALSSVRRRLCEEFCHLHVYEFHTPLPRWQQQRTPEVILCRRVSSNMRDKLPQSLTCPRPPSSQGKYHH